MKVKGLPSIIVMDIRLDSKVYYLGAQVDVSHGGIGTCGRRFDEYKCRGFLIYLRKETMGSYALTRLN